MNNAPQRVIDSPVLVLIGPTAIGKTALSLELAKEFDCEIISVDSMQVYRHMDIGTAKPTAEEREKIAHHLIDVVDPDEQFDSAQFVRLALPAIDTIITAGKIPLLTGGTGLYLRALLHGLFDHEATADKAVREGLVRQLKHGGNAHLFTQLQRIDPGTASRIHPNDTQRLLRALEIHQVSGRTWSQHLQDQTAPPVRFKKMLQIGLKCDRHILYERIGKRSEQMLRAGLVREVEGLRKMGYIPGLPSMQSIGYRHANNYIDGVWNMDETMQLLIRDTRRYAKRQLTWFGSDPALHWFDRSATDDVIKFTENRLHDLS